MATQPPANMKPLFYDQLEPLSSQAHQKLKIRSQDRAPHLATAHAIPLTVDEFVVAQRDYPIVFSASDQPVPLALMGLNEGVNVYVSEDGRLVNETYIPAYVRRYPFMLARLREDAEELSLCFDPSSPVLGEFDEGLPLFDGDKPSPTLNEILKFCEDFEIAAQRTTGFVNELVQMELLIDGEVAIQPQGADQPMVYRGFKMIDEQKMRDLDAEKLHRLNQNGALPLIMAHLFSLPMISDVFGKQMAQGKIPQQLQQTAAPASADA